MKNILKTAFVLAFAVSASAHAGGQSVDSGSTGATEQAQAPAEAQATRAATSQPRMICKNERQTGSRQSKKTCRSEDELKAHREAAKDYVKDGQRRTLDVRDGG